MSKSLIESTWPASGFEDLYGRLGGASGRGEAESERVDLTGAGLDQQVCRAAPCILELPGKGYLGVLEVKRGAAILLAPDLSRRRAPLKDLHFELCLGRQARHAAEIESLLEACQIPDARRDRARLALLEERLRGRRVGVLWEVREHPGASFWRQFRRSGLTARLLLFAAAHVGEYSMFLLSWWLIGQGALEGRIDTGWLFAWALLLLTMAPLRALTIWSQAVLSIGVGGLLKQRLLAGALQTEPDEIRHQGAGQLLGRVIESQNFEQLALSGGLTAVLAAFELIFAAAVLGAGQGAGVELALLGLWTALAAGLGWRYARRRARWTDQRLSMTHGLVEQMAGHRTRMAQQHPGNWHDGEDDAVDQYLQSSARLDRATALLDALIPRGWLLVGMLGLVPAFLNASGEDPGWQSRLAIGVGGVLLGERALRGLVGGVRQLAGAAIAWRQVKPLFDAASHIEARPLARAAQCGSDGQAVLEAHDLRFRHHDRGEEVIRGVSLRIEQGDWLLLEGESGGGKSTLAALLSGLRHPDSGLLLAGGLDPNTLGARGWRKRVVAAPQYHENYIFSGTLSFNLLMGRQWPPSAEDLAEAAAVSCELGLGPLIERMPAGLEQMVGETGWQLSQGERSRVFIARALLQGAQTIVLDESLAALDPETARQSLECVLKRAPTLVVIAHP